MTTTPPLLAGAVTASQPTAQVVENERRDREIELAHLVNMVPSHIWRVDTTGTLTFVNKRMAEFLGISVSEIVGTAAARTEDLGRFIHADDAEVFARTLRRCLESGSRFEMRYRLRRSDGVYRWMSSRAEPVRDSGGRVLNWYGVCHDIDAQAEVELALRESEHRLRQIVDTVPALIWCTTPDGTPSYINKRLTETVGVDLGDLIGPNATRSLADIHPDDKMAVDAALEHSFATGEPFSMRYRQRRADGSFRWTEGRAEPLRSESGKIIEWYGVCVDIDDQQRLYSDIAERESRIRRLVESDIIGIVIWDLDGTLIDANDAFLRMVRYERADLEGGLRWFDMTPPDWQAVHAHEEAEELAATGKMQPREKEYFRKDGSRVPVLIGAACFEGQSRQGVAYILDLSERKRAETALRERERELSQLVDVVPSFLWRITPKGVPVFFNKRFVDFLGFDVSEIDAIEDDRLSRFIEAAIHPDDAAVATESFTRSLASGERLSMKWRMRRADGAYRWMTASAEAMRDQAGTIVQWYGLCHDIDDQVMADEALRQSKQQLEQMIDAVPVNILSFSPSGKLTYASKRYLEQAGTPTQSVDDFDALALEVAHPDDFPAMFQRAREGFANGQPFVNRFRRILKGGGYRWIEARAQPLRDPDGTIVQWYIASIDIEHEMRAQEALRARERFVWQLIETLPAMIDCARPDGEPIYRSQQLRQFLGYDLEELDGTGVGRLAGTLDAGVHPDDVASVKEEYRRSLETGEPYARRHRLKRYDGDYRWVETRAAPMRDAEDTIVQWNVICLDIDGEVRAREALRLAQDRLARASQAAGLAELSASIAHEVNQPLAAITANSHACFRWLSATPPNLERAKIVAERIIRDANSAADVVGRIRALFKQSADARTITPIASLFSEARDLLAEEALRLRVRFEFKVETDLPPAMLDRVQIQQVLVNLMRNGMEAMERQSSDKVVTLHAERAPDGVALKVEDLGPGLDEPDRIFEPFFTTKRHGMGMGLAICRSIVEAHGGRLWAEENEPQGTRMIFVLPTQAVSGP